MTLPDLSTLPATMLKSGNLFGSTIATFTEMGIEFGFIVMILTTITAFLLYSRSKNITATGMFLFLVGAAGAFSGMPGEFGKYFFGIMALGLVMGFYNAVSERF